MGIDVSSEQQSAGFASLHAGQTRLQQTILEAIQTSKNDLQNQILVLSKSLAHMKKSSDIHAILTAWQARNQPNVDSVVETLTRETDLMRHHLNNQKYLDSLYFSQIEEREMQILDAHKKTFNWIFDEGLQTSRLKNFATWAQSSDQADSLYWITGKPGSGKSTLMRYIFHHARTREHLKIWAGERVLQFAGWFFWNAGNKLQKSQQGLLRSLLYGMLGNQRELIPAVSAWRWRSYDFGADNLDDWSEGELRTALRDCMEAAALRKFCVCLFIDGLDEFEGSEEERSEIVSVLKNLSEFENVKVCLSSRPWRIFEDAFKDNSMLRVQDLTREDICLYVKESFESNDHFQHFKRANGDASSKLQEDVAQKSEGVFLWVFLVVRSLLRGFRNRDPILMIMQRLERMPSDLDGFFKHMLTQIEDEYRSQAVTIFRLALTSPEKLSLMLLSFMDEVDPEFGLHMPTHGVLETVVQDQLEDTAIRLNVRCKDFLEVHKRFNRGLFTTHYLDFLHRTMRDFLQGPEIQIILTGYSQEPEIEVNRYLTNALLGQIKMLRLVSGHAVESSSIDDFMDLSEELLLHVTQHYTQAAPAVRKELSEVMRKQSEEYELCSIQSRRHEWMAESTVARGHLACALQWKLRDFVNAAITKIAKGLPTTEAPLLSYAVSTGDLRKTTGMGPDPKVVRLLLQRGADPNQQLDWPREYSVWRSYLSVLPKPAKEPYWFEVAEQMVLHGAVQGANELYMAFSQIDAKRLTDVQKGYGQVAQTRGRRFRSILTKPTLGSQTGRKNEFYQRPASWFRIR